MSEEGATLSQPMPVAQPRPIDRQRVRVTFARGANARYVGHLDLARTWERILRRARLPLAYSEGFNPRPRLTFAAALPVGCTSDHEVLDVVLSPPCDLADVRARLDRAVPAGLQVLDVVGVPYSEPALPMQTRAAEFVVSVETEESLEQLQARVRALLDAPSVERTRRDKTYDLRPLILDLWVESGAGSRVSVGMRLRADESGTGRPDEVAAALGWDPAAVHMHRRKLIFA